MSIVKFEDLHYTYSPKTAFQYRALKGINISIEQGSFHAVIGHIGSGKSTLIQHINGLLFASSGQIKVKGYEIKKAKKIPKELFEIRKQAALVFQFPELQLFAETVEKDIMFGPLNFGVSKIEAKEIAKKYLLKVGLPLSYLQKSPFELSGGEKRRVAIAGILALKPEILVVDEPTAGLDPLGKQKIMEIINELHQQGLTIILVTHNMNDVWKYSQNATLLSKGKVLFHGLTTKLFQNQKLLDNCSLSLPLVLQVRSLLKPKGYNISWEIKDINDLVKAIVKAKKS